MAENLADALRELAADVLRALDAGCHPDGVLASLYQGIVIEVDKQIGYEDDDPSDEPTTQPPPPGGFFVM